MSGVIDSNGQQWEHCHGCTGADTKDYNERGKWVKIEELMYEPPSEVYKYGRDLCPDCGAKSETSRQGETVTITLPQGYMGQCHCGKDAKYEEWVEFDTPIPEVPGLLPEVKGVFGFVCDDHRSVDA